MKMRDVNQMLRTKREDSTCEVCLQETEDDAHDGILLVAIVH